MGQQAWVARFVPLLLAKPMVQGVIWNQLRDSNPHGFPHGGLFDGHRRAKLRAPHAGRHPPDILNVTTVRLR